MNKLHFLALGVSLLATSSFGNFISNGDFESLQITPGTFQPSFPGQQLIPNWHHDNGITDIVSNDFALNSGYFPHNGTQTCYINDGISSGASIRQDINLGTGHYTLSFDQATFNTTGKVQLDVFEVLEDTVAPAKVSGLVFSAPYSTPGAPFAHQSVSFDVTGNGNYAVLFSSLGAPAVVDNISLEATPEPATVSLVVGVAGILLRKRRK